MEEFTALRYCEGWREILSEAVISNHVSANTLMSTWMCCATMGSAPLGATALAGALGARHRPSPVGGGACGEFSSAKGFAVSVGGKSGPAVLHGAAAEIGGG